MRLGRSTGILYYILASNKPDSSHNNTKTYTNYSSSFIVYTSEENAPRSQVAKTKLYRYICIAFVYVYSGTIWLMGTRHHHIISYTYTSIIRLFRTHKHIGMILSPKPVKTTNSGEPVGKA